MNTILLVCLLAVNIWFASCQSMPDSHDENMERSIWSPGRIIQVSLALLENALLTFVLLFPSMMDPIIHFVNSSIGYNGSRRRRAVRSTLTEHAGVLHNLFLDALDKFQELDAALSLETV